MAVSMCYCGFNPKDPYSDVSCQTKPHLDTQHASRAFELRCLPSELEKTVLCI